MSNTTINSLWNIWKRDSPNHMAKESIIQFLKFNIDIKTKYKMANNLGPVQPSPN